MPINSNLTLADVAYGDQPRQVLDLWKAKSDRPTPVVIHLHGGGWVRGDKQFEKSQPFLDAGISVVSANYRYTWQAQLAGVVPPVAWPMQDVQRALQFVRYKSLEWNIDRDRIGVLGGSAGACSGLWLALHADMRDSHSADPVERESTRLWCAGLDGVQTTLDPYQMKEWTPNSTYGGHAFGYCDPTDTALRDQQFDRFYTNRNDVMKWIKEYSPIEHASKNAPPICMKYDDPPAIGERQRDPTHTANFGVKLSEKLQSFGVQCELIYPGASDGRYSTTTEFLIDQLKKG